MAITLVKENGTGLSDANVYADLSDLELHAELLGEDLSGYDDELKKSALYVAANKYIDRLHEFIGEPVQPTQNMKLYTDLVTYADAGRFIVEANAEAAILHLKGFLFVDPSEQSANGDVIRTVSNLDVLEEEIEYSEGTRIRTKYNTNTIDALLAPYIKFGTGGTFLRVV